jgi:hypothetical protein
MTAEGGPMRNYFELLGLSDAELAKVDPVEMNLLVAKSVPSLAGLDISGYQRLADEWTEGVRERFPHAKRLFWKNPPYWKNDENFTRLAVLVQHLDCTVGIRYKEEDAFATSVLCTDPADVFLNGVMDTRRGTCGNMAILVTAIAWRLGWPVSMACARAHYLCRYYDGRVAYNLEASQIGQGAFSSPEDSHYIDQYKLTPRAVSSGSDLRALKPREMLGLFVGCRARHMQDSGNLIEAEKDYLLARHLFPTNHQLYFKGTGATLLRAAEMFGPEEEGAPLYWADCMELLYGGNRSRVRPLHPALRPRVSLSVIDVGCNIKM